MHKYLLVSEKNSTFATPKREGITPEPSPKERGGLRKEGKLKLSGNARSFQSTNQHFLHLLNHPDSKPLKRVLTLNFLTLDP